MLDNLQAAKTLQIEREALERGNMMEDSMDEAIETLQQDLEKQMTSHRASREQSNSLQTQNDSLRQEREWLMVLALFAFFGWASTGLGWWLL